MGNASSNMTRARSDTGPTLTTPEKKEMVETFDVVVVGCGAGGCIATKEMVDAGFKVHTIEKDKGPGGLYRHFYYDGLMTSSWTYTAFSIFPSRQHDAEKYPDSHPNHWTGPQYVNYLQHFMEHFDLLKLCDFETELTGFEINDADDTYTLRTNTGKTYITKRIVLATGTNAQGAPIPPYPGADTFTGTIMHSQQYSDPSIFMNKDILIVGGGESAADICIQAGIHGSSCHVSIKNGKLGHQTPRNLIAFNRFMLSTNIDADITPVTLTPNMHSVYCVGYKDMIISFVSADSYVAQKANFIQGSWSNKTIGTKSGGLSMSMNRHGVELAAEIDHYEGNMVHFKDGTSLKKDIVLFAIGFKPVAYKYLNKEDPVQGKLLDGASFARKLFKHALDPNTSPERIAFVGLCRPAFGNIPTECEMQSRFLAGMWSGKYDVPTENSMAPAHKYDNWRENLFWNAKRVASLNDYCQFCDGISRLMPDVRPDFSKLSWAMITRLMIGQMNVSQYRLNDPDPKIRAMCLQTMWDTPISVTALWDTHIGITYFMLYCFGFDTFRLATFPDISRGKRLMYAASMLLAFPVFVPSLWVALWCVILRCFNPLHFAFMWRTLRYGEAKLRPSDGSLNTLYDWFCTLWIKIQVPIFAVATAPVTIPTAIMLFKIMKLNIQDPEAKKDCAKLQR